MSLRLYPSDSIKFDIPLTRMVEKEISLENVEKQPLVFKIKTNAPKSFCVRPNVGHINPLSTVKVKVYREPIKDESTVNKSLDDKFLILSIPYTSTNTLSPGDLLKMWANIESAEKGRINKYKIGCEYQQAPASLPRQPLQPSYAVTQSAPAPAPAPATTVQPNPPSPPTPTEAPPSYNAISETSHQLAELQNMLDSYKQEISGLRRRDPETNREREEEAEPEDEEMVSAPSPQLQMQVVDKRTRGETGYSIQVVALVAVVAFALGCLVLSLRS